MGISRKTLLLERAEHPGKDWISGWRILQAFEVSNEGEIEERVFVRNLLNPTERPPKGAETQDQFSAYWDAINKKWLLENPKN